MNLLLNELLILQLFEIAYQLTLIIDFIGLTQTQNTITIKLE